jgi:DinB superfamily
MILEELSSESKSMPHTPTRPAADEYAPAFARYIHLVQDGDVVEILEKQLGRVQTLLKPLSDAQSLALHAPYTWTLKQVLGHLTDCERIFGYRALRLGRHDATPLPGFDENQFMQFADFNACPMAELLEEFAAVRRGHVLLFRHLSPSAWEWPGTVIDHAMTPRALAYVMAGHVAHHLAIMKKRLGG